MKIRLGFVSNSSTSSFLVIGWKTSKTSTQIAEALGLLDSVKEQMSKSKYDGDPANPDELEESSALHDALYDSQAYIDDSDSNSVYVGRAWTVSDDDPRDLECDLDEIVKSLDELKEKLGEDQPVKVFLGTMMT